MKRILLLSFFTIVNLLNTISSFAGKHALIIAIGKYPTERTGWPAISSNKDVGYIKNALLKQDFQAADIHLLEDEKATVKGISDALEQMIANAKPGDVALIHISSHGEQVQDDNEDETDGLDECIVTYNAVAPSKAKRDNISFEKIQGDYFRDDLFGDYINRLREKLGKNGDVIVLIDACHSGTATRGFAKVRGGEPALVDKDFNEKNHSKPKLDNSVFKDKTKTTGGNEDNMATYIVFSAARAEELNYESLGDDQEWMGSLTYAWCKAFENLDNGITYRGLFGKIQGVMSFKAPRQRPVMEGTGMDRQLFGGKIEAQKAYVEIDRFLDGRQIQIKSGRLNGLTNGSKVQLFAAGTLDPAKASPLAEGTISKITNFNAVADLDKKIDRAKGDAMPWVFVTEINYEQPVIVKLASQDQPARGYATGFSANEAAAIKNSLKDLPRVKIDGTEKADIILVKGNNKDSLITAGDSRLFKTVNASNKEDLKNALNGYAQYKFLKNLSIDDPDINVDVVLVPVVNGVADTNAIENKKVNGVYEYAAGDQFVLWVKNKSDFPVYVNVLDIQPDGIVNKILPNTHPGGTMKPIYPSDLKIKDNHAVLFKDYVIKVGPPYGSEVFKVFLSREEINMENLSNSRGSFSALEDIVRSSGDMATRGTDVVNVSEADGATQDVVFIIKQK